jgi:putative FmdB family regulatory protein
LLPELFRQQVPAQDRGACIYAPQPHSSLGSPVFQFPDFHSMPIYEFECTTCGERFDRLQKLSDPDPEACPQCGAPGVRRCLTAPSFRLSGSGWYETDFKKDGDKKRNLVDKVEPKTPEAKPVESGKPAEGKPAEKKPAEKAPVSKAESKPNPAASS